jgi:hypothetical protein
MDIGDLPYNFFTTTNSSSSDITSPVTPTFSAKGHYRGSSSTSSLDLAYTQYQESPASPTQQGCEKTAPIRQLPDVKEEPFEREEEPIPVDLDSLGLYSCLCDAPCQHSKPSHDRSFSSDMILDYDLDYDDMGWMSDCEVSNTNRYPTKQDGIDSPFLGLTNRLGSGLNTINRWKYSMRTNLIASPTTEVSFENVMSRAPSGRSTMLPTPAHSTDGRSQDLSALAVPSLSLWDSVESINSISEVESEANFGEPDMLERDRAKATTPLLPPLMTSPLAKPPRESPLQSPTIAPYSIASELPSPTLGVANYSRPSLSAKPSFTSLRHVPHPLDLPLPLPAILQSQDEWCDRLGHANFQITPQPYDLEVVNPETVRQFRDDWDTARVNYTKHLVRTGENYGETSKIYNLTEAKWVETEQRWRRTYEKAMRQTLACDPNRARSISAARSRSRGRRRGRSESASAAPIGRRIDDVLFADEEWRRLDDPHTSAVPRLMDANGKFPERGDEDIVGPMHRAETMIRSHSEEKHGAKFWKSLVGKVGLRR